jgi:hypothetical protein
VRDSSLLAHELLCLHLRSFYGIEPCSPWYKSFPGAQASERRLPESSPYSFFAPPEIAFAGMADTRGPSEKEILQSGSA